MNVYLAGGMHSDWRERVKTESDRFFTWHDPSVTGEPDVKTYALWDAMAIRNSDIVFAYLEKDNPSGMGTMVEIGYAKGLGKTVLFINEKHDDRYTHLAEEMADWTSESLDEGIITLSNLGFIARRRIDGL